MTTLTAVPDVTGADTLAAALAYAARGWPVFPCRPGRKDPATAHGVLDATTDPAQIRAWWSAQPGANIGIATGAPGPDVLDVDVKPEGTGWTALTEIADAGLITGAGTMIRTPSGGLHAYFTGSSQRNGSIRRRHLDFRGAGGYVVAPPSTVNGRPYESMQETGATGPADWGAVRALLDPPPDPAAFQQPSRDTPQQPAGNRPGDDYTTRTTWDQILAPAGWRKVRDLGNGRACWCRPGKAGGFTSATTREDGGLYVFSTSTQFDPEVPYSKFGAYAVLGHGGDHAAAAAQLRRDGYGEPSPALTVAPPLAAAEPGKQDDDDLAALAGLASKYQPVNWHEAWDTQPAGIDWLFGEFLETGTVNALFAKPGTGKSLVTLEICVAIARAGRTVVYVDDENRITDLVERLQAFGCTPGELDRLRMYSFAGLPPLDTIHGGTHLLALAVASEAAAVVLDTTTRMVAGRENDSDTFLQLYRCSLVPLKARGVTVLRLDHPGKDADRGQRGSSAKDGDVDTIWRLSQTGLSDYLMEREKSRSGHGPESFALRRLADPLRHEWNRPADGAASTARKLSPAEVKLLGALTAEPSTRRAIVDRIAAEHGHGLTDKTVRNGLSALLDAGLADQLPANPGRPDFWLLSDPGTPGITGVVPGSPTPR